MMHEFAMKLREGQAAEAVLDSLFSSCLVPTSVAIATTFGQRFRAAWQEGRFVPIPSDRSEQRRGIDRHFSERFTVEYKADMRAATTHNAFIETVSVDTEEKPGWAYSAAADVLAYYVPGDELVYILRFSRLRNRLPDWKRRYPERSAQNAHYRTHGLCVPLAELEACADVVVSI